MADKAGQADIRSLNIVRSAKAYAQESLIFSNIIGFKKTNAREIRWFQKTSGYLTATAPATVANIAPGARPFVMAQTYTRNTSYSRKYMLDSPMINMEDISDNDVSILLETLQDTTEAVMYQKDQRIWNVITEDQSPVNINSVTSTAAWDAGSGQDPVEDISEAIQKIREQTKRKVRKPILLVSAKGEKDLKVWLTTSKGTYFTELASKMAEDGVLTRFAGCTVVVSENVTDDYAAVLSEGNKLATWHSFKPVEAVKMSEEGIGTKVRVWEEGECTLDRPKYIALISNTET